MSTLDWLILGGGVHGTYLSHVLVHRGGVAPERLRVLDPHERPLEDFWRMTAATGMRYLRSGVVHHLGLHPYALRHFARKSAGRRVARFVPPYDRPGLAFFRAHVEHLVADQRLDALREQGRARRIEPVAEGYRVETDRGSLVARRLVLAVGLGEQLHVPAWATLGPRVEHLFSPSFRRESLPQTGPVTIVGGGISAAQLACALAARGAEVTLVARHEPRVHRFDSDPEWLGPRAMDGFSRLTDPTARRQRIAQARHRGSLPPEIHADLRREMQRGRVRWLVAEARSIEERGDLLTLHLDRPPGVIESRHLVLATGFEARRPGGALVDDAIERLRLPCAPCGYPVVSPQLAWTRGLFVTGPLAELELGPSARNIAGARAAGERLLSAC